MSKRQRRNKNVGGGAEDTSSVAKEQTPADPETNSKLADFAKKQAEKAAAKAAKEPKLNKDGRAKLPALPRAASKQKPLVPCACGCPAMTRSTFYPGHDSRLKGWALRIARGVLTLADMTEKYGCVEGEQKAVEAHIKQLKKEGKWEALKLPQAQAKKAAATAAE